MYARQDPEDIAQYITSVVHRSLNLVPGAKVMVLIARPDSTEPDGLFSEMSYDRAHELLTAAQTALETSRRNGLQVIASAMGAADHG